MFRRATSAAEHLAAIAHRSRRAAVSVRRSADWQPQSATPREPTGEPKIASGARARPNPPADPLPPDQSVHDQTGGRRRSLPWAAMRDVTCEA